MKSETRIGECPFEKTPLAGGHIVVTDDVVSRGEEAIDHMAADKARGASD